MGNKHRLFTKGLSWIFLVVIGALSTACATGHPPHLAASHAEISERIASARTASDYRALAQFFRAEAEADEQLAKERSKLTQMYTSGVGSGYHVPLTPARDPSRHCQALVKIYTQAAKENRALAQVHDELAAQAGEAD